MDIHVARRTATTQHPTVGEIGKGRGRMAPVLMTLLAQPWRSNPEQPHIVAPVSHVAVQTVLSHGRVFP